MTKVEVRDQSGFCRHSNYHHLCRGMWETPSALVTCSCVCHQGNGQGEVVDKPPTSERKIVAKKLLGLPLVQGSDRA